MNTTITKDQMLLKDNEVYVLDWKQPPFMDDYCLDRRTEEIIQFSDKHYGTEAFDFFVPITHSTAKLDGVIHLQREWFVKVEDASQIFENNFDCYADTWKHEGEKMTEGDVIMAMTKEKFVELYNAKKGEFTSEEIIEAMEASFNYYIDTINEQTVCDTKGFIFDYISKLQPLYLPEKIILSPDGELIEIQW